MTVTDAPNPPTVDLQDPPPVGEEIHLPGGSILPLIVAIGCTITIVGLTVWIVWSAIGVLILIVSIGLWIRDVRHDMAELPEEHASH